MRKLISLFLLLTMLIPGAMAEETGIDAAIEIPVDEAVSANITPLPVDLSAGYVPNPDCYIAADEANGVLQGYQDESLIITMERVKVGDSVKLRFTDGYAVTRVENTEPLNGES